MYNIYDHTINIVIKIKRPTNKLSMGSGNSLYKGLA